MYNRLLEKKLNLKVKRWDNVKYHKDVATYPYHLHLPNDKVIDSEPMNLKKVLTKIGEVLPIKGLEG